MKHQFTLTTCGLLAGLAMLISSCGGGGGGSTTGAAAAQPGKSSPTPLRAVSSRNERTQTSADGSITLRVRDVIIAGGQSTPFTVVLTDSNGNPAADQPVHFQSPLGLQVSLPNGDRTGADGTLNGSIYGASGGALTLTAATDTEPPFNGLSVDLVIIVNAPVVQSPTGPVETPTPLPCTNVSTIIVQTDTPNVSSQAGGRAMITAVVFDANNLAVSQVNVLFDVQPRIANFDELVQTTGADGTAVTHLNIPPNSTFGTLSISASACGVTGVVSTNVVSGVSTKPVTTLVLQADPSTVGSLAGGTINLTAAVFDADNKPIDGIDVLFITAVGNVNPLVDRTRLAGSQGGIATSTLQIPAGAVEQPYGITALAGGVSGSVKITVVAGRVGPGGKLPGVPPGEPAGITLGASPTRIQVAGTGGTDLSTVIGRVFDNNGSPLSGVRVHYHVVAAQSAPGAVILPVTTPTLSGTPLPIPTTLCEPDDPVAVSDVAGFAVIQVHSGPQPGPVTVAACADTTVNGLPSPLREQQAVVTVTSGPVSRIGIAINSRFINNNDGTLLATASAIVTDAQGNTVEDGTPVSFEVVLRKVCAAGSNAGQPCASDTGCPGSSCVQDPTDPSGNVAISSNTTTNASPPCDVSQFIVQTGFPISPQPGDAITCVKYPLHQQASEVLVRARVGGVEGSQVVTLAGHLGDIEARVSPSTVSVSDTADGLALVQTSVFDDNLDPVENVRVRFATSIGTVDRSALSDANGDATATLTVPAGTVSGTALLRAAAGGIQITNIAVPIVNTGGGTPTPGTSEHPAAIRFIGAQPDEIGVRGSGLPEQSTLTFQVTDAVGSPLRGALVNFSIARIADESIAPSQDATDEDGNAQVTLTSGRRAMSIQVTAQVATAGLPITTRSTAVTILGGPPSQPNFSLAHRFANISGRVTFGLENEITAFVADRFGNPVPPGTAVAFTTKGGAIGNPTTTTTLGQATATLVSQAPVADDGIVASLATTSGERPFVDVNGNGVCDDQDQLLQVPEPFYDANCNRVHDAGEDFIDLNADGEFNADQGSGTPACGDQIVVFDSICTTFSASTSVLLLSAGSGPIEAGGSRDFSVTVSDNPDPIGNPGVGNPIVGGSTIDVSLNGTRGRIVGLSTFTLPDAQTLDRIVDGVNRFAFSVVDNSPGSTSTDTSAIVVTVRSDPESLPAGGNGSATVQSLISFLPVPTQTFTPTPTHTETPTPTFTPTATFTNTPTLTFTPTPTNTLPGPPPNTPTNTPTDTPPATSTVTPTGNPTAPAGSVQFIGATPAAIGVRGSGLSEQSALTFQVNNTIGGPISGVTVQFTLSGTGSESLNPPSAVSDASGMVSTTVTSGIQAATVRVVAALVSDPTISGQSTAVSILGAPPAVNHFSLAAEKRNVAGRVAFGLEDTISAFVNDRFGNAVPPGTSVSFVTNAASVVNPTTTNSAGVATATLQSEGIVPPTGIVTVLAFTRGEESFFDNNGNGIFDSGDAVITDNLPEPFIDFRPLPPPAVVNDSACTEPAPSALCNNMFDPSKPFERFVDVNASGGWDTQGTSGAWDNNIFVFGTFPVTFSGPLVAPAASPTSFAISNGGAQAFTLEVHDDLVNPLVGGSTITITSSAGTLSGGSITVPDGESFNRLVDGLTRYSFVISDSDVMTTAVPPAPATVVVTITSQNGGGTFVVASGTVE